MPNLLRVKDPISGAEYDVPQSRLKVCPDLEVLNKPTGARAKPRLPLGDPLPGGKVDRRRAAKKTAAEEDPADKNDGQTVETEKEND